jgi:hypothetical protein
MAERTQPPPTHDSWLDAAATRQRLSRRPCDRDRLGEGDIVLKHEHQRVLARFLGTPDAELIQAMGKGSRTSSQTCLFATLTQSISAFVSFDAAGNQTPDSGRS